MSIESRGGIISTGENFWFVLQWPLLVLREESSSSKAKGTGEGNDEFLLTKYLFYTSQDSLTCRKMLRHVADGFTFALKKGVLREFYRSLKLSSSVGFKPANLGSNDNDTNHYTTENDTLEVYRSCVFSFFLLLFLFPANVPGQKWSP
jgi:hypothetical protein